MGKIHSIEPFPNDIDREYFGAWLSGFSDGESSFGLVQFLHGKNRYLISRAEFFLGLRADDFEIIKLIQSYWQCGNIHFGKRDTTYFNAKPSVCIRVHRAADLMNVVIPHFEKFPLMAKKKRDYQIWKEGVILQYNVKFRGKRCIPGRRGTFPQWKTEETEYFAELVKTIRATRKYESTDTPMPEKKIAKTSYTELF